MNIKHLLLLLFTLANQNSFTAQQCAYDYNENGVVDGLDLLEFLTVYGQFCEEGVAGSPIISEIHYNPSPEQGQDSEWEFIEIYNPHSITIDINGCTLADGIDAVVPEEIWIEPGRFMVFVSNLDSYVGELPYSTHIFEWSTDSELDNSSEYIRLIDAQGVEVDIVSYSDMIIDLEEADGGGPSIEWKGQGYDNASPESWMPSNSFGGSPGTDNSTWAD